uniref:Uncharacterized protein n=1 Tax=Kwoniella bestiolae CBS 10118 TaxID=1296100 RepID=A0A1B9GFE7_9TREE|nr:hypothetical protein I302_01252 [Kwoniella bestiolae CBS 10118]OCF29739.1 hypothetical protein I302_01252 [Kwoniella bestiolae CBS 10118]
MPLRIPMYQLPKTSSTTQSDALGEPPCTCASAGDASLPPPSETVLHTPRNSTVYLLPEWGGGTKIYVAEGHFDDAKLEALSDSAPTIKEEHINTDLEAFPFEAHSGEDQGATPEGEAPSCSGGFMSIHGESIFVDVEEAVKRLGEN